MFLYAKYCPVAAATHVIGDAWTPLIVRELLYGTDRFNQLVRNVPGVSRTLLTSRLRALERAGVVECKRTGARNSTSYALTPAGRDLQPVIDAMDRWGTRWARPEPKPFDLDPHIMICMLKSRIHTSALPEQRVVIEVLAKGPKDGRAWLVCEGGSVSMCFDPPGFDVDLWVEAHVRTMYDIWRQQLSMTDALAQRRVEVAGQRGLVRSFARWFDAKPAASPITRVKAPIG